MNRKYECMVILRPDLSDQEHEEISEKIVKKIESLEGKVSVSKIWEKERNFFFFLKSRSADKKKYFKGCYWLINFVLDTENLSGLKEIIRLEERILRNMIINKENTKAAFTS